MPSGAEWFIVLAVVLVIFGGSQLPKLAKNLGKAQKEFKDGLAEGQVDTPTDAAAARADTPPPRHRLRHRRPTDDDRPSPDERTRRSRSATQQFADVSARRGRADQSTTSVHAAPLEDAPALALAAAAPHAVVDAVLEGVLEARVGHRAPVADLAGLVHAHAVAREERGRRVEPAVAVDHPGGGGVLRVRGGCRRFQVHRCFLPAGRGENPEPTSLSTHCRRPPMPNGSRAG